MVRRWCFRSLAVVLLTTLSANTVPYAGKKAVGELPELKVVLSSLSRMASLYRDNALRFSCDETIYYSARETTSVMRFRYIYRYSAEADRLEDFRVLRGRKAEMSPEKQERIALAHYGLPEYLVRAYSWVFVFEEQMQEFMTYRLAGQERWQGRPAILVHFEPQAAFSADSDKWYGTAWVDRETYQLLHVEAIEAEQFSQFRILQRKLAEPSDDRKTSYHGGFTYSVCSTDFDVVKHGMRFPGRTVVERAHYQVVGARRKKIDKAPIFKVIQVYDEYRFFSVRTEEQIREVVSGDAALSRHQ